MPSGKVPALLVLPGWDDDGRQQFDMLTAAPGLRGWICHRANIPDACWPADARSRVSRSDSFTQVLEDYMGLAAVRGVARSRMALLGFSFGGYMAALLTAAKPVQWLALRSPALYPDADWDVPKEALDKRALDDYRTRVLTPAQNRALEACSRFRGDVLLVDSECDQVIAAPVITSYERAFGRARSLTRLTLAGADHQLSQPQWQKRYHAEVAQWLCDRAAAL